VTYKKFNYSAAELMIMEKEEFKTSWDLTQKKDLDLVMAMFPTLSLTGFVYKKILDIFNTDTSKQAKAAEELIKAGKENGVDEMEIKLKQFAGGKLNIPEDVNIDVQIGKSEETVIKVKYK
jgi:hypothetical protein